MTELSEQEWQPKSGQGTGPFAPTPGLDPRDDLTPKGGDRAGLLLTLTSVETLLATVSHRIQDAQVQPGTDIAVAVGTRWAAVRRACDDVDYLVRLATVPVPEESVQEEAEDVIARQGGTIHERQKAEWNHFLERGVRNKVEAASNVPALSSAPPMFTDDEKEQARAAAAGE